MNARFDAERDLLIDTSPPPQTVCTAMREPYAHPDPAIAKIVADYQAALLAARGPEPVRAQRFEKPQPAAPRNPFRRPGFAHER
jgi:hypothetical protein